MPHRKGSKKMKAQQIFQDEEYEISESQQEKEPHSSNQIKDVPYVEQQEGEILQEDESSPLNNEELVAKQLQALNKNNQNGELYQDSSDQDNDRLEKEKRKREELWKQKYQKIEEVQDKKPLTEAQLMEVAFSALQRTNKRVMLMRKKNEKRMEDLQKIRMAQQPYLTTGNTHFRGSSSEYSIITHDSTGKAYYHPNHSFRVGEMRLQNFILKNIKEESTANYLNEVVKFENYAYQQRKKRRHNIQ